MKTKTEMCVGVVINFRDFVELNRICDFIKFEVHKHDGNHMIIHQYHSSTLKIYALIELFPSIIYLQPANSRWRRIV